VKKRKNKKIILSSKEQESLKKGGAIAAELKRILRQRVKPGIKTKELDQLAEKFFRDQGVSAAFKGYRGYPATIITAVNEEVIHALPGERILREGDLLSIDLGLIYQGIYLDTALTMIVGKDLYQQQAFCQQGQRALEEALAQCRPGQHVGDISAAMQRIIENAGWSVVRDYTGHGIGPELHLPPAIPCFGKPGRGQQLQVGQALAVEVMYTEGSPELETAEDGWTVRTQDRSRAGHFEETVLVTEQGPLIVTKMR